MNLTWMIRSFIVEMVYVCILRANFVPVTLNDKKHVGFVFWIVFQSTEEETRKYEMKTKKGKMEGKNFDEGKE